MRLSSKRKKAEADAGDPEELIKREEPENPGSEPEGQLENKEETKTPKTNRRRAARREPYSPEPFSDSRSIFVECFSREDTNSEDGAEVRVRAKYE